MNYIPPSVFSDLKRRQLIFKSTNIPTFSKTTTLEGQMKSKKVLGIKKKIKKKIYIIFINGESLGSPYNTNQFLLKKHESLDNNNRKEVQPPGSLLAYLLNEKQVDHQSPITNNFDSIKETQELPQVPLNQYQI
ncbi:unnamed protein product (macronuclear) [Paramecium tetraurelia]|uniref:Uncharacterized protein n=1 Tax=Paramecium tetraurelia TaxID=5888 RepID=A0BCG9_PARTE|nr:uncharacterized protein GSPATT00004330001 [Paramecium tetraurelia]CAK56236.1 unnamed protein product [Paramecium tetraurelia]|eukprot:XP_001423634.1 hypothetical protein (macronuclear) [Paramecium tetraurelia strain d4-2]